MMHPLLWPLLSGCFLFASDPTVIHEIPTSTDPDTFLLVYGCANGQPLPQDPDGAYLATYPEEGVILTSQPAFEQNSVIVRRQRPDGSFEKLDHGWDGVSGFRTSAEGRTCMYEYKWISSANPITPPPTAQKEAEVEAGCGRCEIPAAP